MPSGILPFSRSALPNICPFLAKFPIVLLSDPLAPSLIPSVLREDQQRAGGHHLTVPPSPKTTPFARIREG